MPARILIVDDQSLARSAIRAVLESHSLIVCGEAKNGKEGLEKTIDLKPEIVLLDVSMPVMNGIEAAREIRRVAPSTKVVFVTNHDSPELASAMSAYAVAFISKSNAGSELVPLLNCLISENSDIRAPVERSVASRLEPLEEPGV